MGVTYVVCFVVVCAVMPIFAMTHHVVGPTQNQL